MDLQTAPAGVAISTGSATLDDALGGGLPPRALVLAEGAAGAGSTEFAFAVLRQAASSDGRLARFASAVRSADRIAREAATVLDDPHAGERFDIRHIDPDDREPRLVRMVEDLGEGDCLVLESAAALARLHPEGRVARQAMALADAAARFGPTLVLLHAPGSLKPEAEGQLREVADAVFSFHWREEGPTRRQLLAIRKLRGLAPALEHEQVPVFDVVLRRGSGAIVSRLNSVL